jgi:ABC-type antimicrobial peptide transport system permease subunit
VFELVEAFVTLRENWKRTLLTASGVMAATIAVVLLASIAIGVRKDFTEQVQDLGVNTLITIPGKLGDSFNFNLGGASYLKLEDAERLKRVPGVLSTSCWTFVGGGATYKSKQAASLLVATTPEWFQIKSFDIEEGRLLSAMDNEKKVCVIGSIAKEGLFGKEIGLGKKITINGELYEVVGVTKDQKQEDSLMAIGSFQNLIYIPYAGLHAKEPESQTDRIVIQIDPKIEPISLLKTLKKTLGQRLNENQFDILTQQDLLKVVYKFTNILQWLLIGLTGIALFVGGIGIMNVMLLSVGERTSEIGIRKAMGAPNRSIFRQFLIESIGIAFFGSLVGLTFSALVCLLLARFSPINPIITQLTVWGTIASSMFTGMIFGIIPSMKAARKDPVKAIQNLN